MQNAFVNEVLILAQLEVHEFDVLSTENYYRAIGEALKSVKGFRGVGLWKSQEEPKRYLAIYAYDDFESADWGLKTVADTRAHAQTQTISLSPADVMRVRVHQKTGQDVSTYDIGSHLSISIRLADPGYGPDLAEEVERIFEEVQLMDGYMGSLVGINDGLDEEVIGIVHWRSVAAFKASLPKLPPYKITLFTRIL